jgi:uncharacterized membrane protein
MIGIILIILVIIGIGGLAKRRGSSPIVWSIIAAVGAILLGFIVLPIISSLLIEKGLVLPNLAAIFPGIGMWIWVGLVALYVRFRMGAKLSQPEECGLVLIVNI